MWKFFYDPWCSCYDLRFKCGIASHRTIIIGAVCLGTLKIMPVSWHIRSESGSGSRLNLAYWEANHQRHCNSLPKPS